MIDLKILDHDGNRRAIKSVLNLADNTKHGIERTWFVIAKDLRAEFNQQVLSKNKTGRIYIRKDSLGRKRRHRASAAGETPANRKGTYRRGAGWVISGNRLTFGDSAPYSLFLEVGTSRMEPRPGLNNAIRASERNILRDLSEGIEGRL